MNEVVQALAEHVDKNSLRKVYEVLNPNDKSIVLRYWSETDFAEKIVKRTSADL